MSDKMTCPNCGQKINQSANECPYCHEDLRGLQAGMGLLVLLVFAFVYSWEKRGWACVIGLILLIAGALWISGGPNGAEVFGGIGMLAGIVLLLRGLYLFRIEIQQISYKTIGISFAVLFVIEIIFGLLNKNNSSSETDLSGIETTQIDDAASNVNTTPENVRDEAFFTITASKVANIIMERSFDYYNTSLMTQEEIAKQWFDSSSVEIKEDDQFEELSYSILMKMYKKSELTFMLYGGSSDTRPTVRDGIIQGIAIFSPRFKLPNGIFSGMSANTLINNYEASVNLCEAEGGEYVAYITFDVPNCEGYRFIADKEILLDRYGASFFYLSDSNGESRRQEIINAVKELSTLKLITIGYFPIEYADHSIQITSSTVREPSNNREMWTYHTLQGSMTDENGEYPIELTFIEELHTKKLLNCIYKNVELGGKIRMEGEIEGDDIILTGKDGKYTFRITINRHSNKGIATDGPKELSVAIADWEQKQTEEVPQE